MSAASMGDDYSSATDRFVEWFNALPGAQIDENVKVVDLRYQGIGRAIVGRSNMKDKTLFRIPPSAILTVSSSDLREEMTDLFTKLDELGDGWLPLVLVLMYEWRRGSQSPWAPYLDILPTTLNSLMFWSEAELQALSGSDVLSRVGREKAEESFTKHLLPSVLERRNLFDNHRNGSSILNDEIEIAFMPLAHLMASLIMAYSFDVEKSFFDPGESNGNLASDTEAMMIDEKSDGDEIQREGSIPSDQEDELSSQLSEQSPTIKAMVPMADMLNADPAFLNVQLEPVQDTHLTMRVGFDTKPGDQIYNTYGDIPRAEFLRCYGYIPKYADNDVVELKAKHFARVLQLSSLDLEKSCGKTSCTELIAKLEEILGDETFVLYHPARASVNGAEEDSFDLLKDHIKGFCSQHTHLRTSRGHLLDYKALILGALLFRFQEYAAHNDLKGFGAAFQDCEDGPGLPEGIELAHSSSHRLDMAIAVRIGEQRILLALVYKMKTRLEDKAVPPPLIKMYRDLHRKISKIPSGNGALEKHKRKLEREDQAKHSSRQSNGNKAKKIKA